MNLIVVMMDSLRTDHVGAYVNGKAKARTPNMDRFAEQALLFENAYVGSFPTLPCRRDLFTGRWGHPFNTWDEMERDLAQGPWLAGADYSLADIAFTPYVTRIHHLNQDWLLDARPHVAGWFERVRVRPAYKSAMEDLFNPDFISLMAEKGAEERDAVRKILDA